MYYSALCSRVLSLGYKHVLYLSQLAENDAEVLLLVHLRDDGIQVVPDDGCAEAAVELSYVVVVEGERLIADGHLGDGSYGAPVHWSRSHSG